MFESSHSSPFLDYFRIPYRIAGLAAPEGFALLKPAGKSSGSILWRCFDDGGPDPQHFWFENIPLFGRLDTERVVNGSRAVALDDCLDGDNLALPFDPSEVMLSLWSEAYLPTQNAWPARAKRTAVRGYYALRPAMPRSFQIWLRRRLSSVQARARFPRWPIETALHDLYDLLLGRLAVMAETPVPWIAPWPEPYRWAIVLSHDVEHRPGYENLYLLADAELGLGYTSSWNFVPERDYKVESERLDRLRADGFEIGLHGLRHDGQRSRVANDLRATATRDAGLRKTLGGRRLPVTGNPP